MDQQQTQQIFKAIDQLAGQCLAFQSLFTSLKSPQFDYDKAKKIASTITPIGSNANSIAQKIIDLVETNHKES